MAKVRVYELAKELGVESKTVLSMLKDMGEFVRSASSTVEAPVERRLKEKLASDPPPTKKSAARKPTAPPAATTTTGPAPGTRAADPSTARPGRVAEPPATNGRTAEPSQQPAAPPVAEVSAPPVAAAAPPVTETPVQPSAAEPAGSRPTPHRRRRVRAVEPRPRARGRPLGRGPSVGGPRAPGQSGPTAPAARSEQLRRGRSDQSRPAPGQPGPAGPRPRPGSTGGLPGAGQPRRTRYAASRQQPVRPVAGHGHVTPVRGRVRPEPSRRPAAAGRPDPRRPAADVPAVCRACPGPIPAMMPKQSSGQLGAPAGPAGARGGRGAPRPRSWRPSRSRWSRR